MISRRSELDYAGKVYLVYVACATTLSLTYTTNYRWGAAEVAVPKKFWANPLTSVAVFGFELGR